jgi:hypothetical protein
MLAMLACPRELPTMLPKLIGIVNQNLSGAKR